MRRSGLQIYWKNLQLTNTESLTQHRKVENNTKGKCFLSLNTCILRASAVSGISRIAEVLLDLGYRISGYSQTGPGHRALQKLGATVYEGHTGSDVAGARALVVSSAVNEQNPEVVETSPDGHSRNSARRNAGRVDALKFGIAVAGSHGKTTTTSMVASLMHQAALDATVVVGGRVGIMGGSNARVAEQIFWWWNRMRAMGLS